MSFVEYPKFKYSKSHGSVIVDDADAEKALEGEWFDRPDFSDDENEPRKPARRRKGGEA